MTAKDMREFLQYVPDHVEIYCNAEGLQYKAEKMSLYMERINSSCYNSYAFSKPILSSVETRLVIS